MRWLLFGFIGTAIGAIGWVVAVVFSVLTAGAFRGAATFFGWMMLASLPIGFVLWIIQRIRK